MSATAALGPYRIVLVVRGKSERWYYFREREATLNHRATTLPEFSLNPADSRFRQLRTAEEVIARRDYIRTLYPAPAYNVFIETTSGLGPVLEDRSTELLQSEAPAERVPHHVVVAGNDILIVPGSDHFWYVRFPGSTIESLKANTPDEAAAAYAKLITLRPEAVNFVEKHQPADISDTEFTQRIENAKREAERANLGLRPGERIRHTS